MDKYSINASIFSWTCLNVYATITTSGFKSNSTHGDICNCPTKNIELFFLYQNSQLQLLLVDFL